MKCNDCGCSFDYPDEYKYHEIKENKAEYKSFQICPYCGSENIEIFEKS